MVGYAKNEAFELIFGNLLIGLGGFLAGLAFIDADTQYFVIISIPIFIAGIIFDVRVLRKFSYDLTLLKGSLQKMLHVIDENMKDIEKSKNEIKDIEEKSFSRMSRAAFHQPLEQTIAELQRKVEELQRRMDRNNDSRRGFYH